MSVTRFTVVDVPFKVVDHDKAIRLLGGIFRIQNAIDGSEPLHLRFHPDNPYSCQVAAKQVKSVRLILKVRRRRNSSAVEFECLGLSSQTFQFDEPASFCYLPAKRTESGMESLLPTLLPSDVGDLDWHKKEHDQFFLPPFEWIKVKSEMTYQFDIRERYSMLVRKQRAEVNDEDPNKATAGKIKTGTIIRFFKDPNVPSEASSVALENYVAEKHDHLLQKLKVLFEQRPIWLRTSIQRRIAISADAFKYLLPLVAYNIPNGPFCRSWIRFGFDPLTDPSAKEYQVLDVRFKHFVKSSLDSDSTPVDEVFTETSVPAKGACYYQLRDIHVPSVQQLIHENDHSETSCREHDGWLVEGAMERIRQMVKETAYRNMSGLGIQADTTN